MTKKKAKVAAKSSQQERKQQLQQQQQQQRKKGGGGSGGKPPGGKGAAAAAGGAGGGAGGEGIDEEEREQRRLMKEEELQQLADEALVRCARVSEFGAIDSDTLHMCVGEHLADRLVDWSAARGRRAAVCDSSVRTVRGAARLQVQGQADTRRRQEGQRCVRLFVRRER